MGFPHTAVHLIDSVQYFSGAPLTGWEVRLATFDGAPGWRVSGELGPRATCELIFLPAAEIKCEYLVFEGDGAPQRLEFPDIDTKGNHWETLGYAPGFRAFLDTLEGRANPRHRLEHCLPTVSILEEMLAALRSDPAVPTR